MSSTSRPYLPYGRQCLDAEDIQSVTDVLTSDWLTTGPQVDAFERDMLEVTGGAHAVAVSSGTAALHCAMYALDIKPGDEVLVPALTFAASANCVLYQGAKPIFCDVEPDTLLIDPEQVMRHITPRTKAVVAVDYAGQPCEYEPLRELCEGHNLALVSDSCHALGATYSGRPLGDTTQLATFSFHPVKHITSGEGGMVVTRDASLAQRARRFRNHGIDTDFRQREQRGSFDYDVVDLGYNYRLSDIACALGRSQLRKLPRFLARRRAIATQYDTAFKAQRAIEPLLVRPGREHAYHLYVVRLADAKTRRRAFDALRQAGIGVNVHYKPLNLHPLYRERLGTAPGDCPVAESEYARCLSLPIFPAMTDSDVTHVVSELIDVVAER
ncbi:MAG: hypothetical protein RL701_6385 [Pseudomonadota bacterium]